jgi:SAM-dependent methyltransferase
MLSAYKNIKIAGGDTSKPIAMLKRLAVIERHLQPSAKRFLDCGCGAGEYVLALIERFGLDTYGIEFDEKKVRRAHLNIALQNRIACGDLQAIHFASCTWDYALLNEVLEHVPDDQRALDEVYRILKPNGFLFISSPNRWFPFETHGVRIRQSGRRVPHWVPFVPYIPLRLGGLVFDYWARNYWQGEIAKMAEVSGFSIVERAFLWLTFEDISGHQPRLIRATKPLLRQISNTLEKLPIIKRFGVSQVLVCRK